MSDVKLSIIIVHTFEKLALRQTLRGLRRAAPQLSFELIIVDNNPAAGLKTLLQSEFPDVTYLQNERNLGFAKGMNVGIKAARGEYVLIFNPDILVPPGALEKMVNYLADHPDIGLLGPKLLNPDGSLQYSCYRLPTLMLPVYRRTPLGRLPFAKKVLNDYFMVQDSHDEAMEVDAMIGASLLARRDRLVEINYFDERYQLYYEDNDLCRKFWDHGFRVVYYPDVSLTHYHRRATADGGLFQQILNKFTWIQIHSFLKYYFKYRGQTNPRITFETDHEGV